MKPIRIVIVDDQPLVRSGIRLILQAARDLEIVGKRRMVKPASI